MRLAADTRGATMVEYLIVIAAVAVAAIGVWHTFGTTVQDKTGEQTDRIVALSGAGGGLEGSDVGGASTALVGDPADGRSGALADGSAGSGETGAGGDGYLGRGDATGVTAVGRGVVDGIADAIGGAVDGVVGIGRGVLGVVSNPRETVASVADAIRHPRETATRAWEIASDTASATLDAGRDLVAACRSGDAYACSRGVTNVASAIVPFGAAGTVARGAGAVRTATTTGNRLRAAVLRRRDHDYVDPGANRVLREAPDGTSADELLRQGGDRREVVLTRDGDGNMRLRTADNDGSVSFPGEERAIAHNHPGAAADPHWQVPSEADIDYLRENPGHHAIVSDRGVLVVSERTRVGAPQDSRVRFTDGRPELNGRYSEVRNATRVDSRDVTITTDRDGNLLIEPSPSSSHPDHLPITPMGRERVGTEVVHDPDRGWVLREHNVGEVHRPRPTTSTTSPSAPSGSDP